MPTDWTMTTKLNLQCHFDNGEGEQYVSTILSTNDWLEFFAMHTDWGFLCLDRGYSDFEAFENLFIKWVGDVQKQLDRAFTAAVIDYNPVSNYDRTEKHERNGEHDINRTSGRTKTGYNNTNAESGAESVNGSRLSNNHLGGSGISNLNVDLTSDYTDGERHKTPETSANVETNTHTGSFAVTDIKITSDGGSDVSTVNSTASYDGTTKQDTITTQKGSTASRSVSTASGEQSETEAESGNEQGTNSETESIRAYGNIGVTTNAQMVQDEIQMRLNINFTDLVLEWFARDCLFYGGWD